MYSSGMTTGLIPGGLLVAVEGIDGAGKTTVAHTLAEHLRARGIAVTISKEPTAGPWGAQLRESAAKGRLAPEEEMRLLLLDRKQHVEELIKPALARNEIVILDRYYPSSAAYQGARGISVSEILSQNAFAPTPDITLILDLEPAVGLTRIRARGDKPNHFETEDNLAQCREIFLNMDLSSRVVIDASRDANEVLKRCWEAIAQIASVKLTEAEGASAGRSELLRPLVTA
jgi:dTMP kinase